MDGIPPTTPAWEAIILMSQLPPPSDNQLKTVIMADSWDVLQWTAKCL